MTDFNFLCLFLVWLPFMIDSYNIQLLLLNWKQGFGGENKNKKKREREKGPVELMLNAGVHVDKLSSDGADNQSVSFLPSQSCDAAQPLLYVQTLRLSSNSLRTV